MLRPLAAIQRIRASIALQAGQTVSEIFFTYVLKSIKDNKLYIGWTDNLKGRLKKHNKGFVESTTNRRPLTLVYFEGCLSKEAAIKRERQLKTGFGRAYLKRRLKG